MYVIKGVYKNFLIRSRLNFCPESKSLECGQIDLLLMSATY